MAISLRTNRRRAFSLVELMVAFVIFLLLSGVIAIAIAQTVVTHTQQQLKSSLARAIHSDLTQVSEVSYTNLLGNTFRVPGPSCAATAGQAGSGRQTCVVVGGVTYPIKYQVSVGPDGAGTSLLSGSFITVSASAALPGGGTVQQSQLIPAPTVGATASDGVVRALVTGTPGVLTTPLYLLSGVGGTNPPTVVAAAQATTTATNAGGTATAAVALLRAPATSCTSAAPCTLSLSPSGSGASTNGVGLAAADTADPLSQIILTPGGLVQVQASVFATASATIQLTAQSDTAGISGPNPQSGSVCLWGTFNDGTSQISVPWCNTGPNPGVLTLTDYAPNPATPNVLVPLPVNTPITLTVDDPNGTCPFLPGMVGNTSSGWASAAVCTSWTWGVPSSFGPVGGTASPFSTAQFSLTPGSAASYQVTWSGQTARPAAGYGTQPVWAQPREAGSSTNGCVFNATCTSTAALETSYQQQNPSSQSGYPEAQECPYNAATGTGGNCLTIANMAPQVLSPLTGPARVTTVDVTSSTTPFTLTASDPDGDPVTITVKSLPAAGTVSTSSGAVSVGQTLVSNGASPSSVSLQYNNPVGLTGIQYFGVQISDGQASGGVTNAVIGFYAQVHTWGMVGTPVYTQQGASNVPLQILATGSDGNPRAGATVTFSSSASGVVLNQTSAVTGSNGVAQITANFLTAAAGAQTVTATASDGVSTTIPIQVSPVVGKITLSATGGAEGSTGSATATVTDLAGAALPGVTVNLAVVSGGNQVAQGIYPQFAGCVTASTGVCSGALLIDPTTVPGSYTVQAAIGSVQASAPVSVSAATYAVTGQASVAQNGTSSLVLTTTDGTGAPLGGQSVTVTSPSTGLTVNGGASATVTTGSAGTATLSLAAASTQSATTIPLTASSGSAKSTLDVQIAQVAGSIATASTSTSVAQGGTTSVTVSAHDLAGATMGNVPLNASVTGGIGIDATATTTGSGAAQLAVTVPLTTPVGTYTATITGPGGLSATESLQVTATPTSVVTQGEALNGGTATLTFQLLDGAGNPMPNTAVSLTPPDNHWTFSPTSGTTTSQGVITTSATDQGDPSGDYQAAVTVGGVVLPAVVVVK